MIDLAQVPPEQRARVGAICELLERPDPPELSPRRHHVTVAGRANRYQQLTYLPVAHMNLQRNDRAPFVPEDALS